MGLKVLVTGASSGIGRACALRFSKDGHEVFATARTDAKLSEVVRLAEEAGGGKVHKGIGDVRLETDVQRNYAEAIQALGEIDVVVLNAGIGWPSAIENNSLADFDLIFNTNVRGAFLWLREILPAFKKRGSGQIIFVNSINGEAPTPGQLTLYTASKFALNGLAQSLRVDLVGSGIKVASVFPGVTDTGIFLTPQSIQQEITLNVNIRELYGLDHALQSEDVSEVVASIAYQSSRSNISKLTVWPSHGT